MDLLNNLANNLGRVIKEKRLQKGFTQQDLAGLAHVSLATLQNIEADRANPAWDTLHSLFSALHMKVKLESEDVPLEGFSELGLPLFFEREQSLKPIAMKEFVKKINRQSSVLETLSKDSREEKALTAFLWALHDHYPGLWKKLNFRYHDWLQSKPFQERSIKLRRICLSNLGKVL